MRRFLPVFIAFFTLASLSCAPGDGGSIPAGELSLAQGTGPSLPNWIFGAKIGGEAVNFGDPEIDDPTIGKNDAVCVTGFQICTNGCNAACADCGAEYQRCIAPLLARNEQDYRIWNNCVDGERFCKNKCNPNVRDPNNPGKPSEAYNCRRACDNTFGECSGQKRNAAWKACPIKAAATSGFPDCFIRPAYEQYRFCTIPCFAKTLAEAKTCEKACKNKIIDTCQGS